MFPSITPSDGHIKVTANMQLMFINERQMTSEKPQPGRKQDKRETLSTIC